MGGNTNTVFLLTLLYCLLSPVTSSLIQYPTHSCYQEDLTFVCTADIPADPDHLLNLAISVLHSPAIDTSRLIHSNLYTDNTGVSQNLTITSLSPIEAPASVVCVSILWSNISNTVISTEVESNSSILVPSHPAAVSKIGLQLLNERTFKLYIHHDGVVHREDLLTYVIELSSSLTQVTYPVSYSNLTEQIFSAALFDTCYKLEVNTSNCVGDTRYFSTTLFLPRLMNETLTRVSLTEFCWYNEAADTLCPGPYFIDFVSQNMFEFLLIQDNSVLENITKYDVYLPTEFCFFVPEEYLILNNMYLRVYMEGIPLTTMDINIPVGDVVPTLAATNLIVITSTTIGVIVLLVLSVFLFIFIVCLVTVVKRRGYY